MANLIWLILIFCWVWTAAAAGPPPNLAPLYEQVIGGEEGCVVPPKTSLNRLALEKGVQWRVVAKNNNLTEPYRLKAGMVLKINNTRIVPVELNDGFVINLPELSLYHFREGKFQRRYSLAVGRRSWPTPTGNFAIRNKTKNPTWMVPVSIQEEMADQGKEVLDRVPPGPENPLGEYWMGTTAPGVGIHATNRPWTVGYSTSHGCIRMLPEEIAQLYPQVGVGLPVKIIYRPVKLALTPEGRIFLEANPNIYRWNLNYLTLVEEAARAHQLQARLDWDKVAAILKARAGIAQDVTKAPEIQTSAGAREEVSVSGGRGVSPLQGQAAKLE
jgi:L,D-transpeptidase ErfK/SrfK